MSLEFAMKYPFSEKAREYLAKENIFAVSELQIRGAQERVASSLQNTQRKKGDARSEIISYVLARILLGCLKDPYAAKKFGLAEAQFALDELEKDDPASISQISAEFFPSVEIEVEKIAIAIPEYLKVGFDLVNEKVENGKVVFERKEFFKLLKSAIANKISDISIDPKSLPENIREKASDLVEIVERLERPSKALSSFKGKYITLPAMKKILEGLPEGKRYYGSMTLAIACVKDNLAREEAEQLLSIYAKNCQRSTHDYTEREALACLDWVYRHPTINFSMKTLKEQGLVDEKTFLETELQFRKMSGKA
ncbi:hypothetical protein HY989_02555 [Candidatus Micrarchaeota archaeon]|nr:hypothetical protein [Candidatus Micrarchaeota archaeon]